MHAKMTFLVHYILGTAYEYLPKFVNVASLEMDMIPCATEKLPWLKCSGTKFQQRMGNNVEPALFNLRYIVIMY